MTDTGKTRGALARTNWRSRGEMTSGQSRRVEKKIADQLIEEQRAAEDTQEEN